MGANGSGKTTLMKVLMRLLRPQKGEVRLGGGRHRATCGRPNSIAGWAWSSRIRPTSCSPPRSRRTWPSARETWVCPRPRWPRGSNEALAAVDALGLRDRPIHHLSYGQQKRVCLAGVLAMQPGILLLDEPTAGLDPAGESQMIELLAAAQSPAEDHADPRRPTASTCCPCWPIGSTCSPRARVAGRHAARSLRRSATGPPRPACGCR